MKYVTKLAVLAIALSWSLISAQAFSQSTEPAVMCEREGVQYPVGHTIDVTDYSFRDEVNPCHDTNLPAHDNPSCGTQQSISQEYEKLAIRCKPNGKWRNRGPKLKTTPVQCLFNCQDPPPPPTCDYDGVTYQLEEGPDAFPYSYAGTVITNPANWTVPSEDELICAVQGPAGDPSCNTEGTTLGSELLTRTKICKSTGWEDNDVASIPELSCIIECPAPPTCNFNNEDYPLGATPEFLTHLNGIQVPSNYVTDLIPCREKGAYDNPSCNTTISSDAEAVTREPRLCTTNGWDISVPVTADEGATCLLECEEPPPPTCEDTDGMTYNIGDGPAAYPYMYDSNSVERDFTAPDVEFCADELEYGNALCGTRSTTAGAILITEAKICTNNGWRGSYTETNPEVGCGIKCPTVQTCEYNSVNYDLGEGPDPFPYTYGSVVIADPANFMPDELEYCPQERAYGDALCDTKSTTPGDYLQTRTKLCTTDGWNDTDTQSIPEAVCTIGCGPEPIGCTAEAADIQWPPQGYFFDDDAFSFSGGSGLGSASAASSADIPMWSSLEALKSAVKVHLETGRPLVGESVGGVSISSAEDHPAYSGHGRQWYRTQSISTGSLLPKFVAQINAASSTLQIVECDAPAGTYKGGHSFILKYAYTECFGNRWGVIKEDFVPINGIWTSPTPNWCVKHKTKDHNSAQQVKTTR